MHMSDALLSPPRRLVSRNRIGTPDWSVGFTHKA